MPPKVSIVVPVWNAEAYLARCVDSILGQTLSDVEVVLVDDGSTDGSAAIIDAYAARDPRVVAVHTENRGPADARHTGVHRATGKYIVLYDDDDYAPLDALERFYARAEATGADLVLGDYWVSRSYGLSDFVRIRHPEIDETAPFNLLRRWLNGEIRGAMWTLLMRRELFADNIRDTPSIGFGEDIVVLVQLFGRAKKPVRLEGEPVYYHLLRERSLASHELPWPAKKVEDHARAIRFILDYAERIPDREIFANELAYYALYHLSLLLIKREGYGIDLSDLETRIFRDYFGNRTARRRLRGKWPKQYVFLMAERRAGWRLVKKALWGTPLMRRTVRALRRIVQK